MYISKKELETIKEYIDNLYWDEDRMSSDGIYFLNKLDNYIKKLEKKKKSDKNMEASIDSWLQKE